MKLTTYFFSEPTTLDAKPYCFSTVKSEFASVQEAAEAAVIAAGQRGNGATSFMIEDDDGRTLEHWILQDANWNKSHA